jgi:hypothetical protein
MDHFISFELSGSEIRELRDDNWRNGNADLQAQTIVRDYLLRRRLRAERIARKIDRASHGRRAPH